MKLEVDLKLRLRIRGLFDFRHTRRDWPYQAKAHIDSELNVCLDKGAGLADGDIRPLDDVA